MLKTRPRHSTLHTRVAECEEGVGLVECRGEVDIDSAPQFSAALDEAIRLATKRLVIDLSKVSFIDSVGVGHIVRAYKALHGDATLQICTPNPHIRMLLEIAGLKRVSSLHPTKEDALAAR